MGLDIEFLRGWIDRTESLHDVATVVPLRALTATLDRDDPTIDLGTDVPPCWHWLYFLPLHRQSDIGPDGHAKRGGFLPPVPLPRRMWAGSRIEFLAPVRAGQTYTVRQLLEGALLVSGNDAANTLADMLGGFDIAVDKMNAKAAAIGATNTHATSPSGLDGPGGPGWTTPHDLAAIFRAALANPVFAQITAQPTAVFPTGSGVRPLVSQNELLARYPGAIGGKTGYTNAARKTFIGAAERNGRRLVIAMMYGLVHDGGPTYWDQAATLLDWGFAQNPSAAVAAL